MLNTKTIPFLLFIACLVFVSACSAQKTAQKASQKTQKADYLDLTGDWTFTIQTPVGNRDTPVTLQQINKETAEGALMEEMTTFTIANDSIFYDMQRDTPIGMMDMKAMGKLTSETMEGIYVFVGGALDGTELTWSAKKK